MKKLFAALFGASMLASVPAYALEEPVAGKMDPRVRHAAYFGTQIVHLVSTDLAPIQVVLEEGEQIINFAGVYVQKIPDGKDNKAPMPRFWTIATRDNTFILQPLQKNIPAGSVLFVLTKSPSLGLRYYKFQLDTREGTGPTDPQAYIAVNMTYPDVAAARYAKQQAARIEADRKAQEKAEEAAAQARLDTSIFNATRNWKYLRQNIKKNDNSCDVIGPKVERGVSDDGTQTTLLFAPHSTLPAPYILDQDNKESLVQASFRDIPDGTLMVIHTVVPKIILRRGERACGIVNAGYDPIGHTSGTLSSDPGVLRKPTQNAEILVNGGQK